MNNLYYTGESKYQPKPKQEDSMGKKLFPYKPDPNLVKSVNLAITLERPLLLQGEPGCGKTQLARAIAYEFGMRYLEGKDAWPYFRWNVTSRTQAQDGRYIYDGLGKLRDAQIIASESLKRFLNDEQQKSLLEKLNDPEGYITWGELGKTFKEGNHRPILLIDEIDKADIDFPNDLLAELEDPSFRVIETQQPVTATHKPIVIITSNSEREMPEAFLRRCLFYYIKFPDPETLEEIVKLHFSDDRLINIREKAIKKFKEIRDSLGRGGGKKASTSELLDWLRYLSGLTLEEAEVEIEAIEKDAAQLGILLKSKLDIDRLPKP